MKKVQLFAEDTIALLQQSINNWLADNKAIGIIRADMQCSPEGSKTKHHFYILYEVIETTGQVAIANQASDVVPQAVVPESGEIELQ